MHAYYDGNGLVVDTRRPRPLSSLESDYKDGRILKKSQPLVRVIFVSCTMLAMWTLVAIDILAAAAFAIPALLISAGWLFRSAGISTRHTLWSEGASVERRYSKWVSLVEYTGAWLMTITAWLTFALFLVVLLVGAGIYGAVLAWSLLMLFTWPFTYD